MEYKFYNELRDRYENDIPFQALVNTMVAVVEVGNMTAECLTDAQVMARIKLTERAGGMFPE